MPAAFHEPKSSRCALRTLRHLGVSQHHAAVKAMASAFSRPSAHKSGRSLEEFLVLSRLFCWKRITSFNNISACLDFLFFESSVWGFFWSLRRSRHRAHIFHWYSSSGGTMNEQSRTEQSLAPYTNGMHSELGLGWLAS